VATQLASALGCGVNDLPLSLDISWFEQKAVAVLLTLLHLGVKNIRLGPNLPAFLTPDAVDLLVSTYGIKVKKAWLPGLVAGRVAGPGCRAGWLPLRWASL
jgi:hydroxylamine reductase (hybrid-cluster protein)